MGHSQAISIHTLSMLAHSPSEWESAPTLLASGHSIGPVGTAESKGALSSAAS